MNDVYFQASLQNTLIPEVGTFNNVNNKEGIFTLEDGEYYLTNNTDTSYRVYYPTKNINSVGFTIEFDVNYDGTGGFGWCLLFNGTYWFGIGVVGENLEFRGQSLPNYRLITSPNTWLHVKCIFDYDNNPNSVHIYVNNSEVKTFTINNNYGIKYIDILGYSGGYVPHAKIKNIIIYNSSKKHYLDTSGLTSLWSKIKSLFATKSDLSNYYTKKQIDILLSKVIINQQVLGGAVYDADIDEYNNETEQTMKTVSAVVEPTSVNSYTIDEYNNETEQTMKTISANVEPTSVNAYTIVENSDTIEEL